MWFGPLILTNNNNWNIFIAMLSKNILLPKNNSDIDVNSWDVK